MTKVVEFWFDYGSASSHLAYWALKDIAGRTAAKIDLKPMLLGAVFQATENRSPLEVEAKGRWMILDFKNYAQRYGVTFRMNPHVIFNTMPLMRAALIALRRGELEPFSNSLFNAIWVDGLDMGDVDILWATIGKDGFDVDVYKEGIQEQDIKDDLKRRSQEAIDRGIFGAPTFFVGETMWWGQDRLEWVEAALTDDPATNPKN